MINFFDRKFHSENTEKAQIFLNWIMEKAVITDELLISFDKKNYLEQKVSPVFPPYCIICIRLLWWKKSEHRIL